MHINQVKYQIIQTKRLRIIDTKSIVLLLVLTTLIAGITTYVFYSYTLPAAAADGQGFARPSLSSPQAHVQLNVVDRPQNTGIVNLQVSP